MSFYLTANWHTRTLLMIHHRHYTMFGQLIQYSDHLSRQQKTSYHSQQKGKQLRRSETGLCMCLTPVLEVSG